MGFFEKYFTNIYVENYNGLGKQYKFKDCINIANLCGTNYNEKYLYFLEV